MHDDRTIAVWAPDGTAMLIRVPGGAQDAPESAMGPPPDHLAPLTTSHDVLESVPAWTEPLTHMVG